MLRFQDISVHPETYQHPISFLHPENLETSSGETDCKFRNYDMIAISILTNNKVNKTIMP